MPRATVVLELVNLVNTRIPPGGTAPGQMLVFTDDITKINNKPVAAGVSQHSGFCFRVREPAAPGEPDIWLCQAGYILPGIPNSPFRNGGHIHARALLDFTGGTLTPGKAAINGGTGDYRRAAGEIELRTIDPGPPERSEFTLRIVTP
jgi:hypothetical protein